MRLLHGLAKTCATFDDANLVSRAGLVPVMALAQRAGLGGLVAEHVRIGHRCGVNAHLKVPCLAAGMIAGADSIDDMDLLRHGAMPALFGGIRAPSTLGSFLRAFTWGNVLQLEQVSRLHLLMDLAEQTHRVKFMIRDRGSNFTATFDAVLADAGIRTVLCNVRTPRMNAIAERWIGGCRREVLDRTLLWNQAHLRQILREYETHHNQHRPHRALAAAAPLKPLPEPVDLGQYRVRRQARVGGLINEYHLVA